MSLSFCLYDVTVNIIILLTFSCLEYIFLSGAMGAASSPDFANIFMSGVLFRRGVAPYGSVSCGLISDHLDFPCHVPSSSRLYPLRSFCTVITGQGD